MKTLLIATLFVFSNIANATLIVDYSNTGVSQSVNTSEVGINANSGSFSINDGDTILVDLLIAFSTTQFSNNVTCPNGTCSNPFTLTTTITANSISELFTLTGLYNITPTQDMFTLNAGGPVSFDLPTGLLTLVETSELNYVVTSLGTVNTSVSATFTYSEVSAPHSLALLMGSGLFLLFLRKKK